MNALILSAAVAISCSTADTGTEALLAEEVNPAREKAIKFLKDKQGKNGHWESEIRDTIAPLKGGATALVTLALLDAGVPADDPVIKKALDYLRKLKPEYTYPVSLRIQVFARLKQKDDLPEIQKLADWLLEQRIIENRLLRGWSYPTGSPFPDGSNTHFAVMGLHAAAQAGAKVDEKVWREIRDLYARTQLKDGGWPYTARRNSTRSMTTAALLGLTVATKYDKNAKGPDEAFEKGMKALLEGKLGDGMSSTYELWVTANLSRALGTKVFDSEKVTKAWYREGVEKLVKEQRADGSWKTESQEDRSEIDSNMPVITTAFGLYFLGPPAKK